MKIGIGSDHGGFDLKEIIKKAFKDKVEFVDYGTNSKDSVDYPDFGKRVGEAVVKGEIDRGIVICGTGIGISIAANKVDGVRCALCNDLFLAKMSRNHNNANVLAMGGRVIGDVLAIEIVKVFLEEEFEGGRHAGRVEKISKI
ncbi:ribose 5-phosphate isomerase B [Tissierella creatinophila]|uniref:Putative sugar phosphate isomerase YwlF n=1 Tax=Tissierella creatinophila DSM 6911 TaxID=1123403 RepID=A0A1U7M3M4_TISCR|nr:ribose 5-phosphate isomerase B [Tissierella creatinophila]OLS01819.1 putative sugar phosphate isomerase YwlF [Tissierella creatinophila DSM 6911]